MSRLSREQKRELKRQRSAAGAGGQPAAGTTPIEVHVPASADAMAGAVMPGAAGAQGCATVGGMPVVAAPGETVQGAILNYLHRLALATGHPVTASIHDERIGYVVPLQVYVDGSSRYTAEPVRVAPPAPRPENPPHLPPQTHRAQTRTPAHPPQSRTPEQRPQSRTPEERPQPPVPEGPRFGAEEQRPQPPAHEGPRRPVGDVPQAPVHGAPQAPAQRRPEQPAAPIPPVPVPVEAPAQAPEAPAAPRRDKATYVLRAVPEPDARPVPGAGSGTPTPPAAGPEPAPAPEYPPTAQPAPEPPARPAFAPESRPAPVRRSEPAVTAEFVPHPVPQPSARPEPSVHPEPQPAPVRRPEPAVTAEFVPQPQPVPQPAPAPAAPSESTPVSASAPVSAPAPTAEPFVAAGPGQAPAAGPVAPGTPTPSTFVLRAVPEPKPLPGAASTRVLRAVPGSAAAAVSAPTGEFGPAPVTGTAPEPKPAPEPMPAAEAKPAAAERKPASAMEALSLLGPEREPDPKPTPARGFDAVAEAVLAPSPQGPAAERDPASAFLDEPVARINEAVKKGRIEAAAGMAERAVAEAAHSLGHEHPEVLKLRELTAYIAYLAGDALRSFHLSLDLARVRRRHRDNGAAYGNVQSAAAAWRAVRDPLQGLHLGRDLIGLWTELAADDGPAADDLEQLESARTRMGRLAERARVAADNPYTRTPRAHGE